MKQEFFNVLENSEHNFVHPEVVDLSSKNYKIQISHQIHKVIGVTETNCLLQIKKSEGLGIKKYLQFNNSQPLKATLYFQNIRIKEFVLEWDSLERDKKSIGLYICSLKFVGDYLNTSLLPSYERSQEIASALQAYDEMLKKIPDRIRCYISDTEYWLNNLEKEVAAYEAHLPKNNPEASLESRKVFISLVSQKISDYFHSRYELLNKISNDLDTEQTQLIFKLAQEKIGRYFYRSPFGARAYFKPLGYAGDFEMMNHLYHQEFLGETLFDQCMHAYLINEPAGLAVKNRGSYLTNKIQDEISKVPQTSSLKATSIASGPAVEIQNLIKENAGKDLNLSISFIDQDLAALKHAQKKISILEQKYQSGIQTTFIHKAIKNIITRGLPHQDYDLIYTAGLFDYFSDPLAIMTAKKLFSSLKEGGTLIIGNYSKNNPCIPFMGLVLDWHLIYRSEEDLLQMFNGISKNIAIEKEPLGVNLFVVIKK